MHWNMIYVHQYTWADPEGGRGSGPPPPPPHTHTEISHKYRVSKQYWSGSTEKSQSYQASIQCWNIIGTPGTLIVIFGPSFPSSKLDTLCLNFLDPCMVKVRGISPFHEDFIFANSASNPRENYLSYSTQEHVRLLGRYWYFLNMSTHLHISSVLCRMYCFPMSSISPTTVCSPRGGWKGRCK